MERKIFKLQVDDSLLYYVLAYNSSQCIEILCNYDAFSDGFNTLTSIEITELEAKNEIIHDEDDGFLGSLSDYIKNQKLDSGNLNPELICEIPI